MKKQRLDILLVEKKYFSSREQAQRAIMAGEILIDDKRITKPGTKVDVEANIRYTGKAIPYVSRGGLKLEKAIQSFQIDFKDKVVIDVGASTGGFTDCALQNGAKKVYAVDVGYGQLAWSLRNDPRVVVMERTNARELKCNMFRELADIITMDVSFISVTKIIPVLKSLIKTQGQLITLIKPQFEAGRENVGKKGVVKDPKVHITVIDNVLKEAAIAGFVARNLDFSPVKGPEGNIEFLALLELSDDKPEIDVNYIEEVVQTSHKCFQ